MTDVIVSTAVMLTRSLSTSTLQLISFLMYKREIEKSEHGKWIIAEELANGETWMDGSEHEKNKSIKMKVSLFDLLS